ncbi:hypothetical protein [Demequina oxidasica]|uniref:hypothetical protein n=1 Tax=Demequina oxidasica TaxID=676199 RepID=UPI00078337D2|nr:hypothetical protein [Demequina oxidasica]
MKNVVAYTRWEDGPFFQLPWSSNWSTAGLSLIGFVLVALNLLRPSDGLSWATFAIVLLGHSLVLATLNHPTRAETTLRSLALLVLFACAILPGMFTTSALTPLAVFALAAIGAMPTAAIAMHELRKSDSR